MSRLDELMPDYDFGTRHSRWVSAPRATVWPALTAVTMQDLALTRPLFLLRHLGRAPGFDRPLFTDGPVTLLETDAPSHAVAGAISRPWQLHPQRRPAATVAEFIGFSEPGWVTYLTDFTLTEQAGGTLLGTETRGRATDDRSRRRFAPYWAMIRPWSGVVRSDMLRAVARAAEGVHKRGPRPSVGQPPA